MNEFTYLENVNPDDFGPKTATGKQRAEKITQLRRDGRVPDWWSARAKFQADSDVPPDDVRSHPAWARVWGRPRPANWDSLVSIEKAQQAWDRYDAQNGAADELRAEREERAAEAERQKDAAEQQRRTGEAAELKARLREQYLRLPGTDEQMNSSSKQPTRTCLPITAAVSSNASIAWAMKRPKRYGAPSGRIFDTTDLNLKGA